MPKLAQTVTEAAADPGFAARALAFHARVPGTMDRIDRHSLPRTAAVLSLCDQFFGIASDLLPVVGAVGTPAVGTLRPCGEPV
jgi:hypothetical protein